MVYTQDNYLHKNHPFFLWHLHMHILQFFYYFIPIWHQSCLHVVWKHMWYLTRSVNGRPMVLTKKSTLLFILSSINSIDDDLLYRNLKFDLHRNLNCSNIVFSFFSFPSPISAHKATTNTFYPLLNPKYSTYLDYNLLL